MHSATGDGPQRVSFVPRLAVCAAPLAEKNFPHGALHLHMVSKINPCRTKTPTSAEVVSVTVGYGGSGGGGCL